MKIKNCTPGKSKTRKGGLGKKGYPGGLKTIKGGPGKSYGFKAYNYVPLDHLTTNPQYQLSRSNGTNRSNQLWKSSERDETLKDIREIAEWEPNEIISHSCLLCILFFI